VDLRKKLQITKEERQRLLVFLIEIGLLPRIAVDDPAAAAAPERLYRIGSLTLPVLYGHWARMLRALGHLSMAADFEARAAAEAEQEAAATGEGAGATAAAAESNATPAEGHPAGDTPARASDGTPLVNPGGKQDRRR
jgi:hypothetical protein